MMTASKIINTNYVRAGLRLIPDPIYLRMVYRHFLKKRLHLKNPKTFNEKIQWLKLYDRRPVYTQMADKFEAKKYVASIIGEKYIIPTYGVWERFDDIDFSKLPDQFVLKCTHDSGGLYIVKDKKMMDVKAAKEKIEKCLKTTFYYNAREWAYKNIHPRIIAEKYMEDARIGELRDYKFFCFNGSAKFLKIDFGRFIEHRANYYTLDGKLMNMGEMACPPDKSMDIKMPESLNRMIEIANKLSEPFPFLRVDLYEVNGEIYFGELTLYPNGGLGKFINDNDDEQLGEWLHLPISSD